MGDHRRRVIALLGAVFVCSSGIAHATSITTSAMPSSVTLDGSSVTLQDSATVSFSGVSKADSLIFTLQFGASTVDTETVLGVSVSGTYATPVGFTLPTSGAVTGTYDWQATLMIGGETSALEPVVVNPASPTFTTTPSVSPVSGGELLTDTAVLSGGYFPTGTLTFTLLDPSNISLFKSTVLVSGNGGYSTLGGVILPTGAPSGTYEWAVTYSGDANNIRSISAAGSEPVVIGPAATVPEPATLTLTALGLAGVVRRYRRRRASR